MGQQRNLAESLQKRDGAIEDAYSVASIIESLYSMGDEFSDIMWEYFEGLGKRDTIANLHQQRDTLNKIIEQLDILLPD